MDKNITDHICVNNGKHEWFISLLLFMCVVWERIAPKFSHNDFK